MDWRIHRFERLASTNDLALDWLRQGRGRPGDVIIAECQSSGRGRRGRTWESPPGALLMTALLPVPLESATWSGLTAAAAIALAGRDLHVDTGVKWPNDVVCGGRKLGGVLVETRRGMGAVGIGLNVLAPPDEVFERPADCLASFREGLTLEQVERSVLTRLGALWDRALADGWSSLLSDWDALDAYRGHRVRLPALGIEGAAAGIDSEAGRLVVAGSDGVQYLAEIGEALFLD